MATHAPTLPTEPAAALRTATAVGWLAVLALVCADMLAHAHQSRPAQLGGTVAGIAAACMVASLATSGSAAWTWYRRGVFVAATVMAGRAVAVGVIHGWGFDAWLSAVLALLAGLSWLGTRAYSRWRTNDQT